MDFLRRTWAEINIPALIHNFNLIKAQIGEAKTMAVVKANAYGHSAKDVAPILEKSGADYFAVSNLNEALQLKEYGIKKPILILGYTPVNYAKVLAENGIIQAAYSPEYAKALSKEAEIAGVTVPVHIKLDTGMGRLGFNAKTDDFIDFDEVLSVYSLKGLKVEGIFTHMPSADSKAENDKEYTDRQINYFKNAVEKIQAAGYDTGLVHCANSAGVILGGKVKLDLCRPGIILYGLSPSDEVTFDGLFPVMSLKSVVSMVKTVNAGDYLGYSRTFRANKTMKIATVTAGYADGYPRLLSNVGEVILGGTRVPIVGKICMDQFMVDVSNIDNVEIGQEVLLFGPELPVDEIAKKSGTINYEIICGVSPRVPRVIIK